MSPVVVWSIVFGLVVLLALYASRMARLERTESSQDTGLAILEFGRAFPNEAIRALHVTADGGAVFVRLYDGKTGIMRNHRKHYACHVIQPGRVRVTPSGNPKGFSVDFLDVRSQNGEYVFATEQEAAEVSLWLLDNYVSPEDREAEKQEPAADRA
ncbi:hypothetical protein [Rhizobium sp. LC145]|uniref:hypothetical protein n=1 Tax=Rhizobium sp. LC145 TaxID=1120688 RepID=UPI000629DF40|nr:hypothetical protein [Rhizobium sp. LC145]KKX25377.1 hypothetical protein YH62_25955 [Rhizobium sp. LC145]TKT46697.1 hypothetical protein FDR95_21020 [Rhizobiaceae bacterium LC148]